MRSLRIILPLVVGTLGTLGLSIYLAVYAPMPGGLAQPHAAVTGLAELRQCDSCHERGALHDGCLRCHQEIAQQLAARHGFHAALEARGEDSCGGCHLEHLGAAFPLIQDPSFGPGGRRAFKHDHVTFGLTAAHDQLACEDCHNARLQTPVHAATGTVAEVRTSTLLGLDQSCVRCHEDVHRNELAGACSQCHSQEKFKPAPGFDHAPVFPLTGAHARVDCRGCHRSEAAEGPLTRFHNTATTKLDDCESCHPKHPHKADGALPITSGKACKDCHDVASFHLAKFGEQAHLKLDLPLTGGHAPVACATCHKQAMGVEWRQGDCQLCHKTPHAESTGGDCRTCHSFPDAKWTLATDRMTVTLHERTRFPLVTPHGDLACEKCHASERPFAERYPGRVAENCRQCHTDPHEPELRKKYASCTTCHPGAHFREHTFDVARHQPVFALDDLHAKLECVRCHERSAPQHPIKFLGLGKTCNACHEDPHCKQFDKGKKAADCASCHASVAKFRIAEFDHKVRTSYALTGEHAKAKCNDCHRPWPINGVATRQYRGTPSECSSCHSDPHRGTLTATAGKTCVTCHKSDFSSWKTLTFDHEKQSSFSLKGAHEKLACAACHLSEKLSDGTDFIRYRPLPTRCEGCHVIKK